MMLMPRLTPQTQFTRMMERLLTQRKQFVTQMGKAAAKVAEIDRLFAQFGIDLNAATAPRPAAAQRGGRGVQPAPKAGRRQHRKYQTTAEQSILAFVKAQGNPSTADINKHWQSESRGGKADNTLTRLFTDKKLTRTKIKGERGSRYTIP
jgi:hypothetical protein